MRKYAWPFLLVLILMLCVPFSFAQEGTQQTQNAARYYVKAVLPENQISNNTYFDLKVQPEQTQELALTVHNKSDQEIMISVKANSASTSAAGAVDYYTSDVRDESLAVSLSDMAEVLTPVLTIPAQQSQTAKIRITMPEQQFRGVVLGGILFEDVSEQPQTDATANGVTIHNIYHTVIGVQLRETDEQVLPNFEYFNSGGVLFNSLPAITHQIRNTEPALARNLEMELKTYKNGSATPVQENVSTINIAPNSVLSFALTPANQTLEPGKYHSEIVLRSKELNKEWTLERDFEISRTEAQEINSNSVAPTQSSVPLWAILLMVLLAVAIVVGIVLIVVTQRRKKSSENANA